MIYSCERGTSLIRLPLRTLNDKKKETRKKKKISYLVQMYKEKIVIKSNIDFGTRRNFSQLKQFRFHVHKMSLTQVSSSSYRCIVAAWHKTGAVVTVFLRKTCSERYALMPPLNEFIGQVHENRAPVRARYNGCHATYRSTPVIRTNDKNAIPHITLRTQNTTKKFSRQRDYFVVFLCRCFILIEMEFSRFCSIDVNYDH